MLPQRVRSQLLDGLVVSCRDLLGTLQQLVVDVNLDSAWAGVSCIGNMSYLEHLTQ